MKKKLKVTIVTPTLNSEKYIEATILSVLNQTYKNIEYIIVDGLSNDKTLEIINKYKKKIYKIISEKDIGMYDAIHKGFLKSNGEYLYWLNSDDLLYKNAIENVVSILQEKKFGWVVGIPSILNEKKIIERPLYHYPQILIKFGLITPCFWGYIPQESTLFSRKLYFESGGLNKKLKYAGDIELWKSFSHYESLQSISCKVGIFRKRKGQISEDQKTYLKEINKIHCTIPIGKILRLFYSLIINLFYRYVKKNR